MYRLFEYFLNKINFLFQAILQSRFSQNYVSNFIYNVQNYINITSGKCRRKEVFPNLKLLNFVLPCPMSNDRLESLMRINCEQDFMLITQYV